MQDAIARAGGAFAGRQRLQPLEIQNLPARWRRFDQAFAPQMLQRAIDMHRAEAEDVGQHILRQRHRKACIGGQTDAVEPPIQIEHEMRHTFMCLQASVSDDLVDQTRARFTVLIFQKAGPAGKVQRLFVGPVKNVIRIHKPCGRETAEGHVGFFAGQSLAGGEIAQQMQIDDLPPPIGKRAGHGDPPHQDEAASRRTIGGNVAGELLTRMTLPRLLKCRNEQIPFVILQRRLDEATAQAGQLCSSFWGHLRRCEQMATFGVGSSCA